MADKMTSRSKLKKYLWKLAFAKWSTHAAKMACEFMMKHGQRLDSGTYETLGNGIFVLYARAFGDNNGVGRLPSKFGKFDDVRLQQTHDLVLLGRDQFMAHTDAECKLYDQGGKEKDQLLKLLVHATFGAEEGKADLHAQVASPRLRIELFPVINALCADLLVRLGGEEATVMQKLFEDSALREGPNPINIFDES